MERSLDAAWRAFQAAAVLLVLGFFLFSLGRPETHFFLSPFVLFWMLMAVLMPFRGMPGRSGIVGLSAVMTLLWILDTTGFLLAPFVLALILAYMLDPLVDRMESRRVGRSLAILLLILPVLVLLGVALIVGLPALATQIGEIIQDTPEFLTRLADWLEVVQERLLLVDIPLLEEDVLLEWLRSVDAGAIMAFLDERKEVIVSGIWSGVLGFGRGLGSFFTIIGYTVLTPVLTYYLLRDYDGLKAKAAELIPVRSRKGVLSVAKEYDHLLSRYLRGQITVALILGVITTLGLLVFRFPNAILLGVLVAVFSVVPYLGLVLSLIPALFIALVSGNVGFSLLTIAFVYGGSQILEGAVISPRIVGESVGLHPVWVVLALAVSGFFLGFVGLLIAVPLAVGVKLLVVRGVQRYRESELFQGETLLKG
ncbi:MAG: AI-2E family transporter [Gemmatimonadales bacterium]|nr:MAG: AI-2E family transporter [Gemmatimonadales bacterium]